MALYALDEDSNVVFAKDATLFHRYRCLECRGPVQKKVGLHKRAHFSHLRNAPACRLYSKSMDHLVLQTKLQEIIPELEMERPFPSILRIADLCWERQKIVFEIQCSPIAPGEVAARQRDYSGEGFDLVWLLDDRLFNKRKLRTAEELLREESGYFFSLQKGAVYDQFELLVDGLRLERGARLPVDLSRPLEALFNKLPLRQMKKRNTGCCFEGDLVHRALTNSAYLQRLLEQENALLKNHSRKRSHWLKRGLHIGLEYLLRKTAEKEFSF